MNVRDEFDWLRGRADLARAGGDYGLAALYDELSARVMDTDPYRLRDAIARAAELLKAERR